MLELILLGYPIISQPSTLLNPTNPSQNLSLSESIRRGDNSCWARARAILRDFEVGEGFNTTTNATTQLCFVTHLITRNRKTLKISMLYTDTLTPTLPVPALPPHSCHHITRPPHHLTTSNDSSHPQEAPMKSLRAILLLSSVGPPLITYTLALNDPKRAMQWTGGVTFALELLSLVFHVILTVEVSPTLGPVERAHHILWWLASMGLSMA